ncbi:MAG: sigma 54-interacting transcriptional regulator [Candidatus Zhuqueibacterota bacterium]
MQHPILIGLLVILCALLLLSALPFPWNDAISNAFIDVQFRMRGDRRLADDIIFVFVGDEDINALGWPLTRDYYGYMTHILCAAGAHTIGIDVLFDTMDKRHPEFESNLADMLATAGNVCLPIKFSELEKPRERGSTPSTHGIGPTAPLREIARSAAGLGFSNFSAEVFSRTVPLTATLSDSVLLSFGAELARLYFNGPAAATFEDDRIVFATKAGKPISIPVDKWGQMRLNHFGDLHNVTAHGFVDLLKAHESAPDSLNFTGKLVIIAVTAPGISPMISTPLASLLPASLIHATVAENIIHRNFIRDYSALLHGILIVILGLLPLLTRSSRNMALRIASAFLVPALYWIFAMIFFQQANQALPLCYPTVAYFAAFFFLAIQEIKTRQLQTDSRKQLLEREVAARETQLAESRARLAELEDQLQQEYSISEKSQLVASEQKASILQMEKELRDLKAYILPQRQHKTLQFADIVHSPGSKMAAVLELVAKVSADNIPVLILGETGTGKELIAHAIHQTGPRADRPFVAINCGALSETLLESELFGHERGSFTGAQTRRHGRFELAQGGTIFLDEITETTPHFQTRLLRVLQEGAFERLGGEQTIKTDARIIAATNRNVQDEKNSGRFRSDLYYRLNGFPISIPPLRERTEDIPLLASHFLRKHGHSEVTSFSDRAMEILQRHRWPGNVRELENIIRRAAILAKSDNRNFVRETDLGDELQTHEPVMPAETLFQPLEAQILDMLRRFEFSRSAISQTAKALGNRDRGTVTEYFRGICFEHVVQQQFDTESAARSIAGCDKTDVLDRVREKIEEYIANVRSLVSNSHDPENAKKVSSSFKGLPKKYHPHLQQLIEHLSHEDQH